MYSAIEHLRSLVDQFPPQALSVRWLASGSAFVTRTAKRFGEITPERPLVAIVLEGRKHVTHAGRRRVLRSGDVLIAPAGVTYACDIVPDAAFSVFITELSADTSAAFARDNPNLSLSPQLGAFEIDRVHVLRASEVTLQAFAHFAQTLLCPEVAYVLLRHRLEDLLLSLSLQREQPLQSAPDLVLAIRLLFRGNLTIGLDDVARTMAVSPSTLRRQLAKVGVSLRDLRCEERMTVAAELLRQRDARVAEVAAQCGYDSPSKFAKQFRRRFGHAPSETGAKLRTGDARGRRRVRA